MLEGWGASRQHIFLFHRLPYHKKLQLGLTEKSVGSNGLEQNAMAEWDFGLFSLGKWGIFYVCEEEWRVFSDFEGSPWQILGSYWVSTFPSIPEHTAGPHFATSLTIRCSLWLSSSPSSDPYMENSFLTKNKKELWWNKYNIFSKWLWKTSYSQARVRERVKKIINFQLFLTLIQKLAHALTGVAQLVGHHPAKRKTDSIPHQGTRLGCGLSPQLGHIQEGNDWCFSLSLPPFLSLLKKLTHNTIYR